MNDSFGGGFNQGEKAQGESKNEGILSVVVKQIKNAQEEGIRMFDLTYRLVKLVALVRNIDHSSTKITYRLEDFTGQIDGNLWLDEEDSLKNPQIMLNSYAEVVASVRTTNGVKNLMIFKISPITTINEANTHWLEVLGCRFMSEEFSKKGAGGGGDNYNQTTTSAVSNPGALGDLGLAGKPLTVYLAIKDCNDEVGISRHELRQKFKHFSETDLGNILDLLNNEGHVYTSIDSDHFLAVNQE